MLYYVLISGWFASRLDLWDMHILIRKFFSILMYSGNNVLSKLVAEL